MKDLLSDVHEGVARITLNRPQAMNAIQKDAWGDLVRMMREFESDDRVRCVLIAGAGSHFCAGGDVKEFSTTLHLTPDERARTWMAIDKEVAKLFQFMDAMSKPVVTSVRGSVAGGGLSLVAASDLTVASETSQYMVAQIKVGAIPDAALSYNLARQMGVKRAKQYCLLGEAFDAQTALDAGIVNWVVQDSKLETFTQTVVSRVTRLPRVALARSKAALNNAFNVTLAQHLEQEVADIGACVSEDEFIDRIRGFMERARN